MITSYGHLFASILILNGLDTVEDIAFYIIVDDDEGEDEGLNQFFNLQCGIETEELAALPL